MRTLLTYSGPDASRARCALAALMREELAEGELQIEAGGALRGSVRKGMSKPIALLRELHASGITFRRCWHHIRSRKAAVRLLYFVLQGEMQVTSSAGSFAVAAGRCAVIDADEPFHTRTRVGGSGDFECALAVIPEQLVLSHLPWARGMRASFEIGEEYRGVIGKLLDVLCLEGDRLRQRAAEPLVEAFLQSISQSVEDRIRHVPRAARIVDRRFEDIRASIQKHLTCAGLSCGQVAADCGISTRYLYNLLRANRTSFSDLLWGQRLPRAREWLVADSFRHHPIHKIARMAGFKSGAHFSRMFKSAYGLAPKDYRAVVLRMRLARQCRSAA